jgi:hypothetical protein
MVGYSFERAGNMLVRLGLGPRYAHWREGLRLSSFFCLW